MTTLSRLKIRHLKKYSFFAAGLSLVISFSGCGGSPTENSAVTPAAGTTVSTTTVAASDDALVDQAVNEFMTALKSGDRQKVESMLTPTSIAEIKKTDLVISPLGGDKMQFTILEKQILQMPGKLGAHVVCEISDVNSDGQVEKHQHLWALRKEANGWRIAGMAAEMFPGETPVLFDFENAEDMVHQLKEISAEMERRANGTAPQNNLAQQPGQPNLSTQPSATQTQGTTSQQPTGQQPVLTAQQPMNPAQQPTFTPQQPSTPNGPQPVAPMQQIPATGP